MAVNEDFNNSTWVSFILHCASWEKWIPLRTDPYANTWIKGKVIEASQTNPKQEKIMEHCNETMIAYESDQCPGCHMQIPNEVQALWKLQNLDQIQEMNNG